MLHGSVVLLILVIIYVGDPKIPGIAKKIIKIFVQFWKFSPLRSTPPCDWMQQSQQRSQCWKHCLKYWKCCQGPPGIRWRPLKAFPLGAVPGIAASNRRWSTSKRTKVSYFTNILNNFYNNSGNFLVTPLIHTHTHTHTHIYIHIYTYTHIHIYYKLPHIFVYNRLSYCREHGKF